MPVNSTYTLYERLGGYDAMVAVVDNFLPRLMDDPRLGRLWEQRGYDGIAYERQLLIDFLCASAGGPTYYASRDMLLTHQGMRIDADEWRAAVGHLRETLDGFGVAVDLREQVLAFVERTKPDGVAAA
jgi:hemoglobin